MRRPEGFSVRKGLIYAGAGLVVLGIALFMVSVVQVAQATTNFMNCLNGAPTSGVPAACTSAMTAVVLFGSLEWFGFILGIVGAVVLIVGFVMEPERPVVAPVYGPPPAYYAAAAPPPQGPQSPPPQP